MKPDTERTKYHKEKIHKKKNRLHVHLSKELRGKLKKKKRSILVHKGDTVKVMRGPGKGKEAKVSRVYTQKRKVYVEGVVARTARGREATMPLEPSNLMLIGLESTANRKELFSENAFKAKKAEKPKAEPKKAEEKPAEKKAGAKEEKKPEPKAEEKPAEKKEVVKKPEPKAEVKTEAPKPPEAPKR